ncbi:hypothetical protein TNCV_1148561 [Trichonephila clavipes]|nr:hypothetical protein TNCV_1148561 [Trichonephila clavipes]
MKTVFHRKDLPSLYDLKCHPFGVVVNYAGCCVVGPGFESRKRLEERWETPDHLLRCSPSELRGTGTNSTVVCIVLKATANDRRKTSPLPR